MSVLKPTHWLETDIDARVMSAVRKYFTANTEEFQVAVFLLMIIIPVQQLSRILRVG